MVFKAPDGGAAENVVQLAQGLGEYGWEIELAGPLSAPIYDRIPESVPVHRLSITPGYGPLREDLAALRGLLAVLRHGRYDLLHVHSAQTSVLARLARLVGGPPVVYTAHCFPFLGNTTRLRSIVGLTIERSLAPLVAAFIDVSEYERRAALRSARGSAWAPSSRAQRMRALPRGRARSGSLQLPRWRPTDRCSHFPARAEASRHAHPRPTRGLPPGSAGASCGDRQRTRERHTHVSCREGRSEPGWPFCDAPVSRAGGSVPEVRGCLCAFVRLGVAADRSAGGSGLRRAAGRRQCGRSGGGHHGGDRGDLPSGRSQCPGARSDRSSTGTRAAREHG